MHAAISSMVTVMKKVYSVKLGVIGGQALDTVVLKQVDNVYFNCLRDAEDYALIKAKKGTKIKALNIEYLLTGDWEIDEIIIDEETVFYSEKRIKKYNPYFRYTL